MARPRASNQFAEFAQGYAAFRKGERKVPNPAKPMWLKGFEAACAVERGEPIRRYAPRKKKHKAGTPNNV